MREAYVVSNFAHDPILLSIEHICVTVCTLARIVAPEPTAGDEELRLADRANQCKVSGRDVGESYLSPYLASGENVQYLY